MKPAIITIHRNTQLSGLVVSHSCATLSHIMTYAIKNNIFFNDRKTLYIAYRADRLGARLNSMVNAMRFADEMGGEFRFIWSSTSRHDVLPVEDVFSKDFLEKNLISEEEKQKINVISAPTRDLGKNESGFEVHELSVQDIDNATEGVEISEPMAIFKLPNETTQEALVAYSHYFNKIEFSTDVSAVRKEYEGKYKNSIGIHLRRGDLIHHPLHHRYIFENRYAPLPIVAAYIASIQKKYGDRIRIVIFGEDDGAFDLLRERFPYIEIFEDNKIKGKSNVQQAMMDLLGLASCKEIIGTYSAYSSIAAKIGQKNKYNLLHIIPSEQRINILRKSINTPLFHPHDGVYLADLLIKHKGSDSEITNIFEKTVSMDKECRFYLICAGRYFVQKEESDKAEAYFKRAVDINSKAEPNRKYWEAYYEYGKILAENGKYEEAKEQFENTVASQTFFTDLARYRAEIIIDALESMAEMWIKAKRYNDSCSVADRILDWAEPNDIDIFVSLYMKSYKEQELRKKLHKLIEADKNPGIRANALYHLSKLIIQEDMVVSKEYIIEAISLDKTKAQFFCHLGEINLKQQNIQEALANFQEATKVNSVYLEAYKGACHCLLLMNQREKAFGFARKLVSTFASNKGVNDWYNQLLAS